MDFVVLVDENDVETGIMEKLEAHRKGLLHRAFSIFIFNDKDELLLQKRAAHKYHSAGLWTNTCCSHPGPAEDLLEAASKRLKWEMGLDVESLRVETKFIYRAEFENGLTEYELDYIIRGKSNLDPVLNPDEAESFRWQAIPELRKDISSHPESYTFWFREIILKNLL
ncbi:MAG: isopentenyl-diphosphate Delta-isomerase [Bacteroidia bacterium]|nr:isopentenyl-diphosphate Delta-isomerase [Bacteroidia bacterium]